MNERNDIPISVLIPVYNSERTIRTTIDSVLGQTFPDFELLLLDDGSVDKSPEIIKSYMDIRVKYIPCPHDFIKTLNYGIDIAQGKYIALLDHDDLMLPHRLKVQYEYMEDNPNIAVCGGYMHSFGMYSHLMKVPLKHLDIIKTMIIHCPMMNPTAFIRRSVLLKNNLRYSDGYSFAADFKLWSDIAQIGEMANIPEVFTLYRTYPEQTSIKYQVASEEAAGRIRLEVVEYFLSLIKKDSKYYPLLMNNFLPSLDELGEEGFFSATTLFPFMHELIVGLLEKGDIILK